MNKNFVTRILLILGYCIPYVFLAMNEDVTKGTLWFYPVMILGFFILCRSSIKTGNYAVVIIGNIISFISSCIFTLNFHTDRWGYYFKPFLPYQLILFETVIIFIIQIIFVVKKISKRKNMK